MARTIAPGNPESVQPVNVKIPDIDLEVFDKLGDAKIKSAMQNFNLYATSTVNLESQKLYQQYKDNPIALANALSKLPETFKDLPESVQRDMKGKLDSTAISLVTKAQANQEKAIIRQNKALAHTGSNLLMTQLADDYFNVLTYITAPDEEKRPIDLEIYNAHRAQLAGMTALTDENGNPLFSESARAKMLMPKEAALAGFKNFIGRAESKQLKEWGENIFQNREKFMKDTGIDADTYDSMDQAYTRRLQNLNDTKIRTLHGQAYYDAINLITEPTQLNIEKAKAAGIIPGRTIDKIAQASKDTITAKFYDPTKKTIPGAFFNALGRTVETLNNGDWSIEGREKAVGQAAESLMLLNETAKEANMSPEMVDKLKAAIRTTLVNKQAAETLELAMPQIQNHDWDWAQVGTTILVNTESDKFKKLAIQNYEANVLNAMNSFLTGNLEEFNNQLAQADRQYKLDLIGFMPFTRTQWNQWQQDVENGKDVVLEYMGNQYKFNGFDAKNPLTLINLI